MSTNHHTPYPVGAALKASVMNVPTGEIDQVITNMLDGSQPFTVVKVGAGAPHASAAGQIDSTTQGFLPPRMTTAQRDAIGSPAEGLVVWNTTTNALNYYDGGWKAVSSSAGALTELIPTTAISASAGISLTSISQDYQDLILRLRVRSTRAANDDYVRIRFNNDSGASNYLWAMYFGSSGAPTNVNDSADDGVDIICTGDTSTANRFMDIEFHILNYTEGTNKINGWYRGSFTGISTLYTLWGSFEFVTAGAINRIDFAALNGNMNGSYALYGMGQN